MRIVLTGGGTGGHLFPIIAVAREIKNLTTKEFASPDIEEPAIDFLFIGPKTIGEEALTTESIGHKKIIAAKFRRYFSIKNLVDFFKFPIGLLQSLWHLFWFMPNVVFSKGGYGSITVVIAAWLFHIPVLTHESDSIPGLANKICAKFSTKIATSFQTSLKYFPESKTALTGNPVRQAILGGSKEEGLKLFNLAGKKPIVLIMGGSQGAQPLNDVVFTALPSLINICEIIHQCGSNNFEQIKQMSGGKTYPDYFLTPFLDENQEKLAFAVSDIIISRAGANSIAEIAMLGKPSIVIPLPESAKDHQRQNAIEYSSYGAAMIIEQMNLTPHLFVSRISALLGDQKILEKMSANAKLFYRPDAGRQIAKKILEIAKR